MKKERKKLEGKNPSQVFFFFLARRFVSLFFFLAQGFFVAIIIKRRNCCSCSPPPPPLPSARGPIAADVSPVPADSDRKQRT